MSNIVTMSRHLSSGQAKFKQLLEHFPRLVPYWNWDECECAYDDLKASMGIMSHGEKVVAQFLLSIWTHKNHDFDILEAASTLDSNARQLITDWLSDPFWP